MGQEQSSTILYNEYRNTFVETIKKINHKLPEILARIDEQRKYFGDLLQGLQEKAGNKTKFVILEKNDLPIHFSKNIYQKYSNKNENVSNEKVKNWANKMYQIFSFMLQSIRDYGDRISNLFNRTDRYTFPAIKSILSTYANYIYKCNEFAVSTNFDFYSQPQLLHNWDILQSDALSSLDRNISLVLSSSVDQVILRTDMPPTPMVSYETVVSPAPSSAPILNNKASTYDVSKITPHTINGSRVENSTGQPSQPSASQPNTLNSKTNIIQNSVEHRENTESIDREAKTSIKSGEEGTMEFAEIPFARKTHFNF